MEGIFSFSGLSETIKSHFAFGRRISVEDFRWKGVGGNTENAKVFCSKKGFLKGILVSASDLTMNGPSGLGNVQVPIKG